MGERSEDEGVWGRGERMRMSVGGRMRECGTWGRDLNPLTLEVGCEELQDSTDFRNLALSVSVCREDRTTDTVPWLPWRSWISTALGHSVVSTPFRI